MKGWPGPNDCWGKFRSPERGGPAWHPLVDHSTDVACALKALLAQPTIRRRLARAGGLDDLDELQVARLRFLAFLHDLGKCSLGFRAKAIPELGPLCGHLAALKPLWKDGPELGAFVQAIGLAAIETWSGDALESLLLAVFAHHGSTPLLKYEQGSDDALHRAWTACNREPFWRLDQLVAEDRRIFAAALGTGSCFMRLRPSSTSSQAC